jgi:hypothetical protein
VERGDTQARISGKAQQLAVTAAERDSAIAGLKEFMKRAGEVSIDWSRIPRVKPLLSGAFVDEEGRLWLMRNTREPHSAFDVYSREGRALGTVIVPHPVSSFIRPTVRGDMAWFVAQETGEVPYVIRARIGPAR